MKKTKSIPIYCHEQGPHVAIARVDNQTIIGLYDTYFGAYVEMEDILYNLVGKLDLSNNQNSNHIFIKLETKADIEVWLSGKKICRYDSNSNPVRKYLSTNFVESNDVNVFEILRLFIERKNKERKRITRFIVNEQEYMVLSPA